MSLKKLEQENILTTSQNSGKLSFSQNVSLAIGAFVLSTSLAIAEPNKTIGIVNFMEGGTAELYKNNKGKFEIRNGNAENGSDYIYGTTIIDGKKYIVYSFDYDHEIEVFLESDLEIYRDYSKKYGKNRAYGLVKKREQYMTNFMKDNPNSNLEEASKGWDLVLEKLN